jgi:4-carboxymuconolactone decarboxylase
MNRYLLLAAMLSAMSTPTAGAGERLPTIPASQYNEEQRQAATEFEAARQSPVFGPFEPMMYSPQLMSRARAMGDYLRYKSALGSLGEMIILMTAREWSQGYEWSTHYPIALKAGVRRDLADALAKGQRPSNMGEDEEIVYNFVNELLKSKQISDSTFERARLRFGRKGVVDMTGIVGYYSLLAMQLNAAKYPTPSGAPVLPSPAG